jgi:hypothetical protein
VATFSESTCIKSDWFLDQCVAATMLYTRMGNSTNDVRVARYLLGIGAHRLRNSGFCFATVAVFLEASLRFRMSLQPSAYERLNWAEVDRAEPNRADPIRSDPIRVEPKRAEQNRYVPCFIRRCMSRFHSDPKTQRLSLANTHFCWPWRVNYYEMHVLRLQQFSLQ